MFEEFNFQTSYTDYKSYKLNKKHSYTFLPLAPLRISFAGGHHLQDAGIKGLDSLPEVVRKSPPLHSLIFFLNKTGLPMKESRFY